MITRSRSNGRRGVLGGRPSSALRNLFSAFARISMLKSSHSSAPYKAAPRVSKAGKMGFVRVFLYNLKMPEL